VARSRFKQQSEKRHARWANIVLRLVGCWREVLFLSELWTLQKCAKPGDGSVAASALSNLRAAQIYRKQRADYALLSPRQAWLVWRPGLLWMLVDKTITALAVDIASGTRLRCLAEGHLQKLATCTRAEPESAQPALSSDRFPSPASTAIGVKSRSAREKAKPPDSTAKQILQNAETESDRNPGEDPLHEASRSAMDRIYKGNGHKHQRQRVGRVAAVISSRRASQYWLCKGPFGQRDNP